MELTPAISVVVATRNRAASLDRLLRGLAAQREAPWFEVIVADNGSSDDTAAVVYRTASVMNVQHVLEPRPGKGRALNAALRVATGTLLVFTDDDIQPDPHWLAAWHAASSTFPDIDVFGGRVTVDRHTVPDWVQRSHNLMGLLTSEHDGTAGLYGFGRYPFGPNMAVRRRRLVGIEAPYPEDMGPGTSIPVGDESAFLMRLSAPGATDRRYVPEAVVSHEVEADNVAFRSALSRSFLQGRAQGRLRIPVTPPGLTANAGRQSFISAAWQRFRACGSLREVACVVVRQLGYLKG